MRQPTHEVGFKSSKRKVSLDFRSNFSRNGLDLCHFAICDKKMFDEIKSTFDHLQSNFRGQNIIHTFKQISIF